MNHNSEQKRFELDQDGKTAFITYRLMPGKLVLIHTEVPAGLEDHGIGGTLARAALDYARQQGLKVVPLCPFVASYIQRHSEYADLAAG